MRLRFQEPQTERPRGPTSLCRLLVLVILGAAPCSGFGLGVPVFVPDTTATPGALIQLPITVDEVDELRSVNLLLTYDLNVATATGIQTSGTIIDGWSTVYKVGQLDPSTGYVSIGAARSSPVFDVEGVLVEIMLQVSAGASTGDWSALTLTELALNNHDPESYSLDGSLTVAAGANSPPTVNVPPDTQILEDQGTTLNFQTSDPDADELTVTASSSDESLVPSASLVVVGDGSDWTVQVTPQADRFGSTVITLTVDDGTETAFDSFVTTVDPVNDAPVLPAIPSIQIPQSAGEQTVTVSGIGPGGYAEDLQTLNLTASSSDVSLIPTPLVEYNGQLLEATLRFTPVAGATGTATVTLTASDDGGVQNGGQDTQTADFDVVVEGIPTAVFTASPTAGDAPLAVAFTDNSSGNIDSWSWDFGDANGSTSQHPSHTYEAAGLYTVSLTVTGPGGSDQVISTDLVSASDPEPPPVASFSASQTAGDVPLAVTFTDNSSGNIDSWSWDFGDANGSTSQHPSHTYEAAGLYTVSLTVTGPGGSDQVISSDLVSASDPVPPPSAGFSASPTAGQVPFAVTLTDNSVGSIDSWSWSFGDGGLSTAQNPVYTYNSSGTYSVSLTVTGPGGADTSVSSNLITASDPPPPPPPPDPDPDPPSGDSVAANTPPVIGATADQEGVVGSDLIFEVPVSDADGDGVTLVPVAAPGNVLLSLSGLQVTASPADGEPFAAVIVLRAVDSRGAESAEATINVAWLPQQNQPPLATDLSVSTSEDTPLEFDLEVSDSDGDPLTFAIVDQPVLGVAELFGEARILYTPHPDLAGDDAFSVATSDGEATDTLDVTVEVIPINDPPVVAAIAPLTAIEGDTLFVDLPALVTDIDDAVTDMIWDILQLSSPSVAAWFQDGFLAIAPLTGASGPVALDIVVADPSGAADSAAVDITVVAADEIPVFDEAAFAQVGGPSGQMLLVWSASGGQLTFDVLLGSEASSMAPVAQDLGTEELALPAETDPFFWQVIARDAAVVVAGPVLSGEVAPDLDAPVIGSGPTVLQASPPADLALAAAVVVWTTNEPATSFVEMDGQQARDDALKTEHRLLVEGLRRGETYSVEVRSADAAGNIAAATGLPYAAPGEPDLTSPLLISGPSLTYISDRLATLYWGLDEPATATVVYTGGGVSHTVFVGASRSEHHVTLGSLVPGTSYDFQFTVVDAAGNSASYGADGAERAKRIFGVRGKSIGQGPRIVASAAGGAFATATHADTTSPLFIDEPLITEVSGGWVTLAWNTDEAASGRVLYGSDALTWWAGSPLHKSRHRVRLPNPGTGRPLRFRVEPTDPAGNGGPTVEGEILVPAASETAAELVAAPEVVEVGEQTAVIAWSTAGPAGAVEYGIDTLEKQIPARDASRAHHHAHPPGSRDLVPVSGTVWPRARRYPRLQCSGRLSNAGRDRHRPRDRSRS